MESGKGKGTQREDKLIGLSIYDLHAMGRPARRNGAFEEPSTERVPILGKFDVSRYQNRPRLVFGRVMENGPCY